MSTVTVVLSQSLDLDVTVEDSVVYEDGDFDVSLSPSSCLLVVENKGDAKEVVAIYNSGSWYAVEIS